MTGTDKEKVSSEVLGKVVLVLAGEWKCSEYGCWDFAAEKNCLSQCIMIEEEMSYALLKRHIEKEFEVNGASNCVSVAEKSGCNDRGEGVGEGRTLSVDSDDTMPTTQDVALLIGMGVTDDVRGENRLTPIDDDAAHGDNGLPVPIAEYSGQREGLGRIVDVSGYMNGEIDVGVIRLDDGTPSLNSSHEYGSVERGEDRVEELVKGGEMSGIDLNSIYNAEVVAQLEVVENMAREAQGLQNKDKGKGKGISNADSLAYGGTSEASNAGVRQCEGETEAAGVVHLGALSPCIEEDSSGGELEAEGMRDTEGSDVDSEFAEGIQLSFANIYNDIIEADVVPSHDCPPCFGEELVQTQEMHNRIRSDRNRLIVRCVDMNCAWRVYGHTMGWNSETMEVRTAILTHTCDVTTRAEYGKKVTCKVIAEVLKSKFANEKLGPRAVDIPDLVLEELSVSITYMKAWHAKEKAEIEARGSAAGSYKLRAKASKHTSEVTPEVEDLLMQRLSKSGNLKVAAASATIFQVSTVSGRSFTVDLQGRSCSCKVFETQGIPCCHALAASRAGGVSITDMVDEYYKVDCWRSAYSAVVMPVPDAEDMDVPEEVLNSSLLTLLRVVSQQKAKEEEDTFSWRGKSKRSRVGPNRCSRCLNAGHNRATCKEAIP
ncbi:unnamed protein product [Arabidopsis arenosa]|uniref:SWIM-type domain-containing protein n=1 Tax=Arabidopsis arenosa TaxID=38785 RepID=A0A8S2A9B8_ARAAE|nr:unnamed protein product [Arabidopsis arenosa]